MLSLNLIVFTWVFLLYTDEVFGKTDYCKFSPKHMLCGGGGFGPKCGKKGNYIYKDITESEVEEVVETHNKLRNELALGRMKGGKGKLFPKASNMEELKWDGEMGNIAAGMIKKCLFKHHGSKLYRNDRHKSIGENIYAKTGGSDLEKMYKNTHFADAIEAAWFNGEKDKYDPADVPKYRSSKNSMGKGYENHGHFTQIIWWNVFRIACAKIGFRPKPKVTKIIVVCHYASAGNVVGTNIYQKGEPCSNCSGHGRTCSTKYKGLCAAAGRTKDPDPDPSNVLIGVSSSSRICFGKIVFLFCLSFISRII